MRRNLTSTTSARLLGCVLGCLLVASSATAQSGGVPRVGLDTARRAAAKKVRGRSATPARDRSDALRYGWRGLPYGYGPAWWTMPQASSYKQYPPPVAIEPRLGLLNNYPFAWQMGLQMPPADPNPLRTYSLGPFQGVVRSPQYPAWLYGDDGMLEEGLLEDDDGARELAAALELMRAGKYKTAGLILAEGYRDSDDARYPILLVEALVGLGKNRYANLLLAQTLKSEAAFAVLPENAAAHFPSRRAFEEKRAAVGEEYALLDAYLTLFSDQATAGLDKLLRIAAEHDSKGTSVAEKLYRHYLTKAFADDKGAPAKPAKAPEKAPPKNEEPKKAAPDKPDGSL